MTEAWPMPKRTEADWRADIRVQLETGRRSSRYLWLRQHRLEQGDRCHYCTCKFADPAEEALLRPTIDHVIPRSAGGEHSFENTVAACWLCNTAKSSMMADEARTQLGHARVALLNVMLEKRRREKLRLKRKLARKRLREEKQRLHLDANELIHLSDAPNCDIDTVPEEVIAPIAPVALGHVLSEVTISAA